MEKEFEYELQHIENSPFINLVINNQQYKEALFEEFKALTPRPKQKLYVDEVISQEKWKEDVSNQKYPENNSIASFVPTSEAEKKVNSLVRKFDELRNKGLLNQKYYGRFIVDTETVKTLTLIKNNFDTFQMYVEKDGNNDNYRAYAKATADEIIMLADKLKIRELQRDVLILLEANKENIGLTVRNVIHHNPQNDQLFERYETLKRYFNKKLRKVLKDIKETPFEGKENKFNSMPLQQVKDYFFINLYDKKSTNGEPFLSKDNINEFIERAFCGKQAIDKLVLNYIVDKENGHIISIFHRYYKKCTDDYIEPNKHCTDKYKKLATDNFSNIPDMINKNFRS